MLEYNVYHDVARVRDIRNSLTTCYYLSFNNFHYKVQSIPVVPDSQTQNQNKKKMIGRHNFGPCDQVSPSPIPADEGAEQEGVMLGVW